jgi:hypothetical protein
MVNRPQVAELRQSRKAEFNDPPRLFGAPERPFDVRSGAKVGNRYGLISAICHCLNDGFTVAVCL